MNQFLSFSHVFDKSFHKQTHFERPRPIEAAHENGLLSASLREVTYGDP